MASWEKEAERLRDEGHTWWAHEESDYYGYDGSFQDEDFCDDEYDENFQEPSKEEEEE